MQKTKLTRKIVSILLLLCFVLPLSRCESGQEKKDVVGTTAPVKANTSQDDDLYVDGYLYPYKVAEHGWTRFFQGEPGWGAWDLFEISLVFFLPAVLLVSREKVQLTVTLMACPFVGLALYAWVFLWGEPEIGGILVSICWGILLLLGLMELFSWVRLRWKKTDAIIKLHA